MEADWARGLLAANLLSHAALLLGVVWCIVAPSKRIYPMETKDGWYVAMWLLFGVAFISNPVLVVLDWNTGAWAGPLRFWLAGPLVLLGGGLVSWGIRTLGTHRTSGLPEALLTAGPYRLTRNPQYLGDLMLFVGVSIASNSEVVLVTHLLTALVLCLAPLAEEPWLEQHYGDAYVAYRRDVPRYV